MKSIERTLFMHLPVVFLLVLIPFSSVGQATKSYNGEFAVAGYVGDASYQYTLSGNDTVLNGPFKLQRSNLGALLDKEDITFLFAGSFKDNYADGNWQFQFGEFESDRQTEVIGYQYKVNISGVQEEGRGNIKMGKPDGLWTYTVNEIKDSEIERTSFKSSIEFDNGVPQKSFQIQKGDSLLVGRFLRNGLAHDEWTLFSETDIDASESWFFENGVLERIQYQVDGEQNIVDIYQGRFANSEIINLDAGYIQILKIQENSRDKEVLLEKGIHRLLTENVTYYKKIGAILSELGDADFLPKFKVKVPHYPLDSLEIEQLKAIRGFYEKSSDISESLLNDTQLNLLKLSEEQAGHLYASTKAISENFVAPLQKLDAYAEKSIISYISRQRLFEHLWPNGAPSSELTVEIDSTQSQKKFKGPNASDYNFSLENMGSIKQMAQYTYNSLDSIQSVLSVKLAKERRRQDLIELEKQLIAKSDSLSRSIDSLSGTLSKDFQSALVNIANVAKKELADYSAMANDANKLDAAQKLVSCFDEFILLNTLIAKQPQRFEQVQEKYTDRIWNPFMATLMDEEVKKRIMSAYRKVLIPYFIDTISKDLSCENAGELSSLLDALHQRMLQLRDEDTAKLERKLKREQNPETVIQLFNLQPNQQ